jgi:hypothetical protein
MQLMRDGEESMPGALCLHDGDDVAVMRAVGRAGDRCEVVAAGERYTLPLVSDVPFGHKVALRAIEAGARVRKYGQPIGVAIQPIAKGEHVHIHNLAGLNATSREDR